MKLRLLLTALIAIPCLLSCNREEESIAYSIELDASYVSFDAGEDEKTVNIVCNSEWTLSTDEDDRWCRASAYKGRGDAEITFKAEPNMATEERSLTYVFQAGDKTEELLVIQDGHVYSISIDSTEFRLDAGGGERKVAVTSSDEWTLEVQEEWCVPSVTSGVSGDTVVFSVDSYLNTEESRTATVTFSCGDKTAEMTVTQEAKVYSLSVEPEELVFEAGDNDGKPVLVSSSDGWTLEVSEDWCVPSAVSGNDGDTVTFSVEEFIGTGGEEEKRKATATFTCGDKMAEVLITQGARIYSISVKPEVLNFEAEPSGELAVQVSSSDEWTLEVADDWCTPSVASGHDGDSVFFSVTDWLEAESGRSTTATFSCGNKTAELLISQGARIYSISVEPEELTFEAEPSGELAVQVSSSDEWTLEVADDWCTPSVTSGQDGDSVSFSVTDWLDVEDGRTTTATFSCGNKRAELIISQGSRTYFINVTPKELAFDAEDETRQEVQVTSSDNWRLSIKNGNWCVPSASEGKNGDKVTFHVHDNLESDSTRHATALFTCGNKTAEVFISQKGKLYSISVEPKELYYDADYSMQEIIVHSSDEWNLKIEDDWCFSHVNYGNNGDTVKFYVYENNEPGSDRVTSATFSCGNKNAKVNIYQKAKIFLISVYPQELVFSAEGNEIKDVTVKSSKGWGLYFDDDWVFYDHGSSIGDTLYTAYLSVEEYLNTESDRTTFATFHNGDKEAKVQITQKAKVYSISINTNHITFNPNDDTPKEVIVSSSDNWTLNISDDWCIPSALSGRNGDTITFSVEKPYEGDSCRTTIATFSCGNKNAQLEIKQNPKVYSISVNPEELIFEKYMTEGIKVEKSVSVNSSDEWTLKVADNWCRPSITTGKNGDIVTFSVDKPSYEKRETFADFTCGSETIKLKLIQEATAFIEIDTSEIFVDFRKQSASINITTYSGWSVIKGMPDWCDDDTYHPSGKTTLDLYFEANYSREERSATLTLECEGVEKELTIRQDFSEKPLVYFKSSNFLTALQKAGVDRNNDGYISEEEAASVMNLRLEIDKSEDNYYTVLPFNAFTSLRSLDIKQPSGGSTADTIDLSLLPYLTSVTIDKDNIGLLDIHGCKSLTDLTVKRLNKVICINASENPSLVRFSLTIGMRFDDDEGLDSLKIHDCPALNELHIKSYNIKYLTAANNTALESLSCSSNYLTELNLDNCTALTHLSCGYNELTYLDLQDCPNLNTLLCNDNDLKSIILNINNKDKDYIKSITNEYGDIITFVE